MTRHVQMLRAYYNNGDMLARQIRTLYALPRDLKRQLTNIVVDDCSGRQPAEDVFKAFGTGGVMTYLYRLKTDVRWNWLGARNRGVLQARDGWLLITDMDHVAPERVLRHLVEGKFDERTIYRFSRIEHTGEAIHPHPNSWFMTRDMFWKVGGFDENLSGFYGTDGEYRRRVAATAPVVMLADPLVRYEKMGDSSTTDYLRKQPEDAEGRKRVRARQPGWKPLVGSFEWEEIIIKQRLS